MFVRMCVCVHTCMLACMCQGGTLDGCKLHTWDQWRGWLCMCACVMSGGVTLWMCVWCCDTSPTTHYGFTVIRRLGGCQTHTHTVHTDTFIVTCHSWHIPSCTHTGAPLQDTYTRMHNKIQWTHTCRRVHTNPCSSRQASTIRGPVWDM